jgi:hypothetical protein
MSSWSRQRRFLYGGTTIVVVVALVGYFGWKLFYTAPTCSDGRQNGSEQGIDCGGACQKLCASAFLPPAANWTRFDEVAPGLYNVAAYIVNPNGDGEALNVPYHMQIYDDKGILITEYNGTVTIPPNRDTLAFRGAVSFGKRLPAKALFEFTGTPDWHKSADRLSNLSITDKQYSEDQNGASLTASLKNTSVEMLGHMSVYAVLYDASGNAIGFSKTAIDGIAAGAAVTAPFTWPRSRNGQVISFGILPVAE